MTYICNYSKQRGEFMENIIGRVVATEKVHTTIDEFGFWTETNLILNPFDVVTVEHINKSKTYAVIEEINHMTDSSSFLSNFISHDFGDVKTVVNTNRIGMNYVKATVVGNTKNIFIPVQSGANVRLSSRDEIAQALGLDNIKNKLVCGYLQMYENVGKSSMIDLPVYMDSRFLIGPEGAHLNISGISGLAAKTSYAMFLLKAIQDKYIEELYNNNPDENESERVAFVVFNVKGRDLLAIDEKNDFAGDEEKRKTIEKKYQDLGLSIEPFKNVKYFYPAADKETVNSYAGIELYNSQKRDGKAFRYTFQYEEDKDSLDLMFANVDDSNQTMEAILNYVINGHGEFRNVTRWEDFRNAVDRMCEAGTQKTSNEITVQSWRKFKRIINTQLSDKNLFNVVSEKANRIRVANKIDELRPNDVYVVDIAKLSSDMQGYVFGNVIKQIYDLRLGDEDSREDKPTRIVIFIDELNKFASSDVPKSSPILKQILDIAERGRSLGVILFGAEQFRSAIHQRVTGNSSTAAYGRTNAIELSKGDYKYIPKTYKGMMTRLKQGEYIIQNPIFRSLLNIKFPEPIYKQFK